MSERTRYPLSWPQDWKRTVNRTYARFKKQRPSTRNAAGEMMWQGFKALSIEEAFDRIEDELNRFSVDLDTVIVSTNLKLNMRGVPTGNQGGDPGVAVYWSRKGKGQCMAIDAYTRVADNLAAVAATLSAMRAIERHGGAQILERAFLGFAQLPERSGVNWREVLHFTGPVTPANINAVEERFRTLAKQLHPDKAGGDQEAMIELNAARVAALAELSH